VSAAAIRIGTSGWHYPHWRGPFYPADLPPAEMLAYYAQRLDTVEVNNSFYRLPEKDTFVAWRDTTPADFLFAVKASRYITHMKKLKDPEQPVAAILERIRLLEHKLGPLLFQLPPRWRANVPRLRAFLATLPAGLRYTFEFRDPTWFVPEVYDLLAEHDAALCIHDFRGHESPKMVVTGWVYIRLHGPEVGYQGRYTTQQLADWAGAISACARQGLDIYCYFNNDMAGYAVSEALELQAMLGC
jgi:uncharacterized protein YecE (DUF72 family)